MLRYGQCGLEGFKHYEGDLVSEVLFFRSMGQGFVRIGIQWNYGSEQYNEFESVFVFGLTGLEV